MQERGGKHSGARGIVFFFSFEKVIDILIQQYQERHVKEE